MKKRYLAIALVIAGLLSSYFYDPSLGFLSSQSAKEEQNSSINFYMKDIETRTFNAGGIHTNTLSSLYATQTIGSEEIHLEQPTMLIALHLSPWSAHANEGLTTNSLKKISLKNDVLLSRTDGIADIRTGFLVFDSDKDVAFTKAPVDIVAKGSQTTADGIFIDLNQEIIHLKNKVRTHYVPEVTRPLDIPSLH